MLYLDGRGLSCARLRAGELNPSVGKALIRQVIVPGIPAIVKTQERRCRGLVEVGFSSPRFLGGTRLRLKSEVPLASITEILSPFDLAHKTEAHHVGALGPTVGRLAALARNYGLRAGLYGSAALRFVTGLPFLHRNSDIDLLLRYRTPDADTLSFYRQALEICAERGFGPDFEILCADGSGIKLAELLGPGKTVLCRGLYRTELREKEVLEWLPPPTPNS